jgi:methyl coenzyme M reductase alpha subunit
MFDGEGASHRKHRIRLSIGMTVHPDTVSRFDDIYEKYKLPRGQVVDKLIVALHTAITSGCLTCVNGEMCRMGRKDIPPVL